MEGLDLTLKLGLPSNQSVDSNKGEAIDGESSDKFMDGPNKEDDGAISNMDVNIMVSNYIMRKFSGKIFNSSGGSSGEVNHPIPAPPAIPMTGNNFVLIDVPARRAQRERDFTNALNANANAGRNLGEQYIKRCTNFNCNTSDTPMWRRGPLGPKTLCNACGIKYRKEEERKRAREAINNRLQNNPIYFNFVD